MVQIRDVAHRADVSVGTVSRVLNGSAPVRAELRQRVEEAIEELGYRPNRLAQSLRRQRSDTWGLVIPDVTNPFFGELALHVETAAARHGHSVILGNSANSQEVELKYVETLAERQVDGLILVPSQETVALEAANDVPIVIVDREIEGYDLVASNHKAGARAATEYLADLGHEIIACIAGPRNLSVAKQRLQGYREVVEPVFSARGIDIDDFVSSGSFDYASGIHAATELLRRKPRPTAIFASSDQQAIGALRACADSRLSVPEDVSVFGFDDIDLAGLVKPRLSTVAQQTQAIAEFAVALLLDRDATSSASRRSYILPTELKLRESCTSPVNPRTLPRREGAHE